MLEIEAARGRGRHLEREVEREARGRHLEREVEREEKGHEKIETKHDRKKAQEIEGGRAGG